MSDIETAPEKVLRLEPITYEKVRVADSKRKISDDNIISRLNVNQNSTAVSVGKE